MIEYFHQVDDPYSHLLVQVLNRLATRYRAQIKVFLVPPPDDAAAPERERLQRYALRDAALVARAFGLSFPDEARQPDAAEVRAAAADLAQDLNLPQFAERALTVGAALWRGGSDPGGSGVDPGPALTAGARRRAQLGHYLGGMLAFEGEWFWGVDRLHYLEDRLAARTRNFEKPRLAPYRNLVFAPAAAPKRRPVVELWFSFRSPYSWIAFPRIRRLAGHYGAELRLRFILPMVMRGLPVPSVKRRYIVFDVKREADTVGLPFGPMLDPVGSGVERAIAVLSRAIKLGRGDAFAERALKAIWAEGLDLTRDDTLRALGEDAGLSGEETIAALGDESWRETAEENRAALLEAGLWGAPTFRVNGGAAHWGQDRLWALEQELQSASGVS